MSLIDCEINGILTWSANCLTVTGTVTNQGPMLVITDKKFYIPVVILSTQDNAKLLRQLKYGFKWTINWNEYWSKIMLRLLIDPSFQVVNRFFVLSYESIDHRTNYKWCILPTVEIKDYNVMIHRKTFLISQ